MLHTNCMSGMQAAAWFQHLGFRQISACPVSYCLATLLGHLNRHQGSSAGLAQTWAITGATWMQQQAALSTLATAHQSNSSANADQHQQQLGNWSAFAATNSLLEIPTNQLAADIGRNAADGLHAQLGFDAAVKQSMPPASQLSRQGSPMSGNPFASPAESFDAALQQEGKGPDAALQQGRAVPPLALHKLPVRFGPSDLQRSLSPKSRFARSKSDAIGLSFTSASLSYSETTSVGYTTRAASPEPGLKQSLLRSVPSPLSTEDPTLAVSNPLFGCTPQRGNSPGEQTCLSRDVPATFCVHSFHTYMTANDNTCHACLFARKP